VMLETPTAIANADAIAAVPGIDSLLIGTNDLAMELGIPGGFADERIGAAYQSVCDACRAHGKFAGVGGIADEALLRRYIGMGVRVVLPGSDLSFLAAAAHRNGRYDARLPLKATSSPGIRVPWPGSRPRLAGAGQFDQAGVKWYCALSLLPACTAACAAPPIAAEALRIRAAVSLDTRPAPRRACRFSSSMSPSSSRAGISRPGLTGCFSVLSSMSAAARIAVSACSR